MLWPCGDRESRHDRQGGRGQGAGVGGAVGRASEVGVVGEWGRGSAGACARYVSGVSVV